ncbi:cytochrome oxidase maturation protein, cbb3-type [Saccharicrinis carchari]|uniref:Cytochrome oxidase maturation protein, cbb3-type n=1 Tax=Saccharicrinis carchari TaxID=1168039 RepID=A0A521CKJ5_SACCC|nr:cbb3-type cytochrome oxidase assembly protein CcoS [Saccharicrinis carchari]SMO59967.1 cytochrome oxidase maturation protein, cbb3-type [Saccharicrinis carchari]
MNILYLLVGVSLLAALVFLGVFIWAVKSGQYEDTYSSSVRILFDDEDLSDDDNETQAEEDKNEVDK